MISFRLMICLDRLAAIAQALGAASRGSLSVSPDEHTPESWQSIVPSSQTASVLYSPFIPTSPPPLAHNISALITLGLDVNKSISWTAGLNGNVIGVQCRPEYGRDLDVDDCVDAWHWMPHDAKQRVFAMRHRPWLRPDIPLPFRTLGCMYQILKEFCELGVSFVIELGADVTLQLMADVRSTLASHR